MEEILNFIAEYGLPHLILGVIIINIIGILKLCKVFSKIKSAGLKKFLYYALDIILSFGSVAVYFKIYSFGFENYILYSIEQLGLTTTIYAIYENFHIRDCWKTVLSWVAGWFKKNPEKKLTKLANKIGIDKAVQDLLEEKAKEEIRQAQKEKTQEK